MTKLPEIGDIYIRKQDGEKFILRTYNTCNVRLESLDRQYSWISPDMANIERYFEKIPPEKEPQVKPIITFQTPVDPSEAVTKPAGTKPK